MAENSYFFNSTPSDKRYYQAADFARYFGSVLTSGLLPNPYNEGILTEGDYGLKVYNAENSRVSVWPGHAIIKGYRYELTHIALLDVEPNTNTYGQDRIDRVILRLDLSNDARYMKVMIKKGTPMNVPQPPELERFGNVYELSLAQVIVRAGSAVIEPSDVTDERTDEAVCGFANSLITVPTSVFQQQFDAWFADYSNGVDTDVQDWYTQLKEDALNGVSSWQLAELRAIEGKVDNANTTANTAESIARGIDGKATEALNKSNQAVSTSNTAKDTAEYVQSQLDNVIADGDSSAEVVQARAEFVNLRDRLDSEFEQVTDQLAQMTTLKDVDKVAPLGDELVTSNGWTLGANWTGNLGSGFTHSTGSTENLTHTMSVTANKFYEVEFTVDSTDADHGFKLRVTIGGSAPFEIYQGAGNTITYKRGIQAVNTEGLVFIPTTAFTGTVRNISVKEIIGTIAPTSFIKDSQNNTVYEMRPTDAILANLFIGKDSGKINTSGRRNVIIGDEAGSANTSGYFNSVVGSGAFSKNTVGSRNVVMGYTALRDNISGHRNIALGTFALNRNTHGHNNIAIGADTLWYNETGAHNIAMGLTALEFNKSGVGNIGIGYRTLLLNENNNFNVALGYDAGGKIKADNNVAIGAWAAKSKTTGGDNVVVGAYALQTNTTGNNIVAIGAFAGSSNTTGVDNVFVGRSSGSTITSGSDNVVIGRSAAQNVANATRSIFIGKGTTAPTDVVADFLNIGNTIYGELGNRIIGIGVTNPTARLHLGAGSEARPSLKFTPGALTLQKHPGSLEYDGTDLYFTKTDGIRYKVSLETLA